MTKEASSLVDDQKELELMFSKNELMPRLRAEFMAEPELLERMDEYAIPQDFGVDVLCHLAMHKRANLETMMGLMFHHLKTAQATADTLLKCAEADLCEWTSTRLFVVRFELGPETVVELERFQYPLPMVVEPREVTNNSETGYLINRGSMILKNNHHDDDVCLDHINALNKVKLKLNFEVANMIKNKWKKLDKPKEGEDKEKYDMRVRAFKKYDRTARDVMCLIGEMSDHFHLTHKYDKRGRTYSQGYHVNYQGNPWNKAVIEFYNEEMVSGD